MDREKPPLNPALKDLADRERQNLGPHPTPAQLADYQAGKLSVEEEEAVRDHLALCHQCADLYLDLVDFADSDPERDAADLSDEQVDAAWQVMRSRLAAGAAAAGKPAEAPEVRVPRAVPDPVPQPPPEPRLEAPVAAPQTPAAPEAGTVVPLQRPERPADAAYAPRRLFQSLAAMFLLTTLGAGFWAISLQRQLREPQVVTATLPLRPGGAGKTRSAEEKTPAAGKPIRILLVLEQVLDSSRYRVELRDANGSLRWTEAGVPASPDDGPLEVVLSLSPGEYAFRVEGLDGEGAGTVTDFPFQIDR